MKLIVPPVHDDGHVNPGLADVKRSKASLCVACGGCCHVGCAALDELHVDAAKGLLRVAEECASSKRA
eukprot:2859969-Prymnesium_polylepis.2